MRTSCLVLLVYVFPLLASCDDESGPVPTDSALDHAPPLDAGADLTVDAPAPTTDGTPEAGADWAAPDGSPDASAGCLDPAKSMALVGQVGNITIYGACNASAASDYLLVWGGNPAKLDDQQVKTIKQSTEPKVMAISGVFGYGITAGNCCDGTVHDVCPHVMVSANTLSVQQLAQQLDQAFAGVSECVGIVAEVPGALGPRCEANDPNCLPLSYCTKVDPGCGCATVPTYQPGAPRTPTLDSSSPLYGLEQPQTTGECTHDGECMRFGCGNHCLAYTAPTFIAPCPCYPALGGSFCGCVSGSCVWFKQ